MPGGFDPSTRVIVVWEFEDESDILVSALCEKKTKHPDCWFSQVIPYHSAWVCCRYCKHVAHQRCLIGLLLFEDALDRGVVCAQCLLSQSQRPAGFVFFCAHSQLRQKTSQLKQKKYSWAIWFTNNRRFCYRKKSILVRKKQYNKKKHKNTKTSQHKK